MDVPKKGTKINWEEYKKAEKEFLKMMGDDEQLKEKKKKENPSIKKEAPTKEDHKDENI